MSLECNCESNKHGGCHSQDCPAGVSMLMEHYKGSYEAELKENKKLRNLLNIEREAEGAVWDMMNVSTRLREKHYKECAEIANSIRAPKSVGRDKGRHHEAGSQAAAKAILQKLEEK